MGVLKTLQIPNLWIRVVNTQKSIEQVLYCTWNLFGVLAHRHSLTLVHRATARSTWARQPPSNLRRKKENLWESESVRCLWECNCECVCVCVMEREVDAETHTHTNPAENSTSAFPPRLSILKPHIFPFTLCVCLSRSHFLFDPFVSVSTPSSPRFSFFISFSPFLSIFAITISLTFPVSLLCSLYDPVSLSPALVLSSSCQF